jgi:Protein of unknown function (DUF2793)
METTGRFDLPLIMPNQAQKHVTHNEALTLIDGLCHLVIKSFGQTTPPPSALIDDAYVVGASATGFWFGEDNNIAFNTDTGWRFVTPRKGIIALDSTTSKLVIFDQGIWSPLGNAVELSSSSQFGINTTADTTNRLALRSNAALLTALNVGDGGNGDMQLKINKETAGDTASLLYQTGFSGRAELGLAGDDDFRLKVSANGSVWTDALLINKTTGTATLANNSIGNAALADMPASRFKARTAAGAGDPEDITGTEATALLDVFSTSLNGLAPASGGGASNFLRADGTWAVPAGGGGSSAWGAISGTLSAQADLQSALNAKEPAITAGTAAQFIRGNKTLGTLDKTAVGLANVDNTSDASKPVSSAALTVLLGKSDTNHSHANATSGTAGFISSTDKTKLDGVAAGATINASDAALRDRASHTGTQAVATISDFSESVDDRVAALLVAGTNVSLNYDDAANTLTVNATAGGGVTSWGSITGTLASQTDLALALDETKNASNLNSGMVADAQLPARLRTSPQVVATADLANQTGTYVCNFIVPEISAMAQWYIIECIAWGTTYLTQRAFAVAIDTPADTRAAYRETNGVANVWTNWSKVLISRDEMDLRYIISGADLVLNSNSNAPSFPLSNSLKLHARRRAGADFLEYLRPSGREVQLQPHMGSKSVAQWAPSSGSTVYTRGIPRTSVGTASTPTLASTNLAASIRRWRMTSAATANSVCDERSASTVCWRGNAAGLGGFFYTNRISLVTLQTGAVAFFGLMASVAALATTQTLAALVNCVGIGFTSGTHANWQLIFNDGTATPTFIDMGTNFPVANFTNVYSILIYAVPNGASIGVRITCENTGAVFEQDLTTKIPANATFLSVRNFVHNGGVAAAVAYDCAGVYLETDM